MATHWRPIPDHPTGGLPGYEEYNLNFNTHVTIHRKYLWVKKIHDECQDALVILQHMMRNNAHLQDRAYAWVRVARKLVDFFKDSSDQNFVDFFYSSPFSAVLKTDVENCLRYWSSYYETVLLSSTLGDDLHNRLSLINKMFPRPNHVVSYDELMQKEKHLFLNSTLDEKHDQIATNRTWLLWHDDAEERQVQLVLEHDDAEEAPIDQPAAHAANVYMPYLLTPAERQFASSFFL